MLSELEVQNWRRLELERLDAMADIESRMKQQLVISTLDGVLNE